MTTYDPAHLLTKAEQALKAKDLQGALARCNSILAASAGSDPAEVALRHEAEVLKAAVLVSRGDYESASQLCREALAESHQEARPRPRFARNATFYLAVCSHRLGRFDDALEETERFFSGYGSRTDASTKRQLAQLAWTQAEIYHARDMEAEHVGVLERLSRAVDDPDLVVRTLAARASHELGLRLARQGDVPSALAVWGSLDRALTRQPLEDAPQLRLMALAAKADTLAVAGELDEALALADALVREFEGVTHRAVQVSLANLLAGRSEWLRVAGRDADRIAALSALIAAYRGSDDAEIFGLVARAFTNRICLLVRTQGDIGASEIAMEFVEFAESASPEKDPLLSQELVDSARCLRATQAWAPAIMLCEVVRRRLEVSSSDDEREILAAALMEELVCLGKLGDYQGLQDRAEELSGLGVQALPAIDTAIRDAHASRGSDSEGLLAAALVWKAQILADLGETAEAQQLTDYVLSEFRTSSDPFARAIVSEAESDTDN